MDQQMAEEVEVKPRETDMGTQLDNQSSDWIEIDNLDELGEDDKEEVVNTKGKEQFTRSDAEMYPVNPNVTPNDGSLKLE